MDDLHARVVQAFREFDLDVSLWDDGVLCELAHIAIVAVWVRGPHRIAVGESAAVDLPGDQKVNLTNQRSKLGHGGTYPEGMTPMVAAHDMVAEDVVTCESGHEICTLALSIPRGALIEPSVQFKRWKVSPLIEGQMPAPCICGRSFMRHYLPHGPWQLHIRGKGWLP